MVGTNRFCICELCQHGAILIISFLGHIWSIYEGIVCETLSLSVTKHIISVRCMLIQYVLSISNTDMGTNNHKLN